MTESENSALIWTVKELNKAREQLRWRDAKKELPVERLLVIVRTKSKFYEPHFGRDFWDVFITQMRDGKWQDIGMGCEVMEWLPIPEEKE